MDYYVRVFCTSSDVPPLRSLFDWCASKDFPLSLDETSAPVDLDSADWTEVAISYKVGNSPILSDVSRDTGEPDCLLREEIAEFIEFLEDVDDGPEKSKVLRHLRGTHYIVANQYLSDIDDDGYDASGWFLNYFVRNHGGMVQCDGEGFYDGDDLIVEVG